MTRSIATGTVHVLPSDFKKALASSAVVDAWNDITPLARNEFICWVISAKLIETRGRRIAIAISKLAQGERRPCCWPGCLHRKRNGK